MSAATATSGEAAEGPPWRGGRVTAHARCVLAPNPGPMTLDGTNTWVLGAPGAGPAVVVDPGPEETAADRAHLAAVLQVAREEHGGVALVVLTHHHADHTGGARHFARLAGGAAGSVPVLAVDPALRVAGAGLLDGAASLSDGAEFPCAGARLAVVAAPGHTADSVCLLLRSPGAAALLTGDTVLGRGTSVVMHPDGDLGAYLATLARLADVVEREQVDLLLPGHGPVLRAPAQVLARYTAHRLRRVEEVTAAQRVGARTPSDVVDVVYPDLADELRPAAERTASAALAYLADRA
ncbi:MBL fold metallo-hydrolase [Pseudokineococcus sp. 1T1Z-3]|uniref:MBL fold metallo-hydrolase n=1 Tax=Pseudokineococcus sp. 1T1Z-3 TaxID=3132745 RepID=UPI0030997831